MGNIPAKMTGKYQSYDINTPSHTTPPMTLRKQNSSDEHTTIQTSVSNRNTQAPHEDAHDTHENDKENDLNENDKSHLDDTHDETESLHSQINELPVDVRFLSDSKLDSENGTLNFGKIFKINTI